MQRNLLLLAFLLFSFARLTAQTLDESFAPIFSGPSEIRAMAKQADEKVIIAGNFVVIGDTYVQGGLARLNTDGTIDNSFNAGTGAFNTISDIVVQNDGKILVSGSFTTFNGLSKSKIVRLESDGSVDPTFDAGTWTSTFAITGMAIEADGNILAFSTSNLLDGKGIARLTATGERIETFAPIPAGGRIGYAVVQNDGKIVIGGTFTSINGQATGRLARLNADGTLDVAFTSNIGTGPNGEILDLALQSDEKIIVIGRFTQVNSAIANFNKIVRINTDGTVDATFEDNAGFNSGNSLTSIAIQDDDKIVVGGNFQQPTSRIIRLNSNGTVDATFNTGAGLNMINTVPDVNEIIVQDNDQVILAGRFSKYNLSNCISMIRISATGAADESYKPDPGGAATLTDVKVLSSGEMFVCGDFLRANNGYCAQLIKLNADGTTNNGFNFSGLVDQDGVVKSVALQSDGKVIIGGTFTHTDGGTKRGLARLTATGSYDNTFSASISAQFSSDAVLTMYVLPNDQIIVGGAFTGINGVTKANFGRLNSNGSLDATFNPTDEYLNAVVKLDVRESDGKMLLSETPKDNPITPAMSLANADGTRVSTFNINSKVNNQYLRDGIFLPDGNILVGGEFTTYDGVAANKLVKIDEQGVRDMSFANPPYQNNNVRDLQLIGNKIFVGKAPTFNSPNGDFFDVMSSNGVIQSSPFTFIGFSITNIRQIGNTNSYILAGQMSKVGETNVSSLIKMDTPPAPAGAPSALTGIAGTAPRRIDLTWIDNSTSESGFEIQRSTTDNTNFSVVGYTDVNESSYSDRTGLVPGTRYYYRVRAVTLSGETDFSNEADVEAVPDAPSTPTGLSVSSYLQTEITLSWTDNSFNETGFEIYRSINNNTSFELIDTVDQDLITYISTGLTASTLYYFKIRAINAGGSSTYSNTVSRTTLENAPTAPTDLHVTSFGNTNISLAWTDQSTTETRYEIFRSIEDNLNYVLHKTIGSGSTTVTDTDLTTGVTYFYKVRAGNAGGNSEFSNEVSQIAFIPAPTSPKNLVVDFVSSNSMSIRWEDTSDNEESFEVYRSTGDNTNYSLYGSASANDTTYFLSSLSPSTHYFFKIRAINGGGASDYTNEANGYTRPISPTTLTATGVGIRKVRLNWIDASETEVGYRVYSEELSGVGDTLLATLPAGTITYLVDSLMPGTSARYYVTSFDTNTESASSNTAVASPSSVYLGEWTEPVTVANVPARSSGIAFVIDGKAYVGLGRNASGTLRDLWEFDPETDTWTAKADFPGTARIGAIAFTINGKGYVGTGNDFGGTMKRDFYEYDPSTNSWTQRTDFPEDFSSEAGITAGAAFAIDGYGYVGLGNTGLNNPTAFFRYDPINNVWEPRNSFDGAGRIGAVGFATGGKGYFAFGYGGLSANRNDIWEYDPTADTWTQKATGPAAGRGGATGFVVENRGHLVAGEEGDFSTSVRTKKVDVYDPDANSWYSRKELSGPVRSGAVGFSIGSKGYVFAGSNGTQYYNDLMAYNPPSEFLPEKVESAVATFVTSTSIRVVWTDVSKEEEYVILVSVNNNAYIPVDTLVANTTEYLHEGLLENTLYSYSIISKNIYGAAQTYTNSVQTIPIPQAPTNVQGIALSSSSISISWTNNSSSTTGFRVFRSTDQSSFDLISTLFNPSTTSVTIDNLQPITPYYFTVQAFGLNGNSEFSDTVAVTTFDTLPLAPSSLIVANSTAEETEISWTDNSSNETGFKIMRKSGGGSFEQVELTTANVQSYTDTDIVPGTTYVYRVSAFNTAGESAFVELEFFVVDPSTVIPLAPSALLLKSSSQRHAEISWSDNSANELGFKIQRKRGSENFELLETTMANITTFADSTILLNVNYTYRVSASNLAGESSFTELPVFIQLTAPEAPSNLNLEIVQVNKINLTWKDNSVTEDVFEIVRIDKGETPYASVLKNETSFVDAGFTESELTYKVRAKNSAGVSAYSEPVTITLPPDLITSLETRVSGLITVWPNPAQHHLYVSNHSSSAQRISVYNLLGVEIYADNLPPSGEKMIDTESWNGGVYLLKTSQNEVIRILKM